jgi:hypothetical protein
LTLRLCAASAARHALRAREEAGHGRGAEFFGARGISGEARYHIERLNTLKAE